MREAQWERHESDCATVEWVRKMDVVALVATAVRNVQRVVVLVSVWRSVIVTGQCCCLEDRSCKRKVQGALQSCCTLVVRVVHNCVKHEQWWLSHAVSATAVLLGTAVRTVR